MVKCVSALISMILSSSWAMGNNHGSTVCLASDMLPETVKVLTEFAQAIISQLFVRG